MTRTVRITAQEAHDAVERRGALLVCAYRVPEVYENVRLKGSMFVADFLAQAHDFPIDTEIIVYCTFRNEASSVELASTLIQRGFSNIKVLAGGVTAWKNAGFE